MAVKTYSDKNQGQLKLSDNFKVSEFHTTATDDDRVLIDDKLVSFLQKIRDRFGKPLYITSAYRPGEYNAQIGGSESSYHTKGQAADFYIPGVDVLEIAKYAESIGILGIGCYRDDDFVHIDTRTERFYWYDQSNTPTDTFGGGFPTLGYGSEGSFVRNLQSLLRDKGFKDGSGDTLVIDGDFGDRTLFAVKAFQKANNLSVDGIVGPDTWGKLNGR